MNLTNTGNQQQPRVIRVDHVVQEIHNPAQWFKDRFTGMLLSIQACVLTEISVCKIETLNISVACRCLTLALDNARSEVPRRGPVRICWVEPKEDGKILSAINVATKIYRSITSEVKLSRLRRRYMDEKHVGGFDDGWSSRCTQIPLKTGGRENRRQIIDMSRQSGVNIEQMSGRKL